MHFMFQNATPEKLCTIFYVIAWFYISQSVMWKNDFYVSSSHWATASAVSISTMSAMGEGFQRKMCLQIAFWVQVCVHYQSSILSGDYLQTGLMWSSFFFFFSLLCSMMIFVPSSSLEVCATTGRKSVLLNVCKMHALQCMKKNYVVAEASTCTWPVRNTTGCTNCHMWETCDGRVVIVYYVEIFRQKSYVEKKSLKLEKKGLVWHRESFHD